MCLARAAWEGNGGGSTAQGPEQAEPDLLSWGPSSSPSFRKGIDESNTGLKKLC